MPAIFLEMAQCFQGLKSEFPTYPNREIYWANRGTRIYTNRHSDGGIAYARAVGMVGWRYDESSQKRMVAEASNALKLGQLWKKSKSGGPPIRC
jgi:hypothetical protein